MAGLVLGGRSEIGIAVARRLAPGATVVLAVLRPIFAVLRHVPRALWRRMPRQRVVGTVR